jgi:hypothetical protein
VHQPFVAPNGHVALIEARWASDSSQATNTQAHVLDYQLAEALEAAIAHNVDAVSVWEGQQD